MISHQTFRSVPESAALARHFAVEAITGVSRDVLDTIALMVSELATNCIRYARTEFTVTIERTADHISVEVTDAGDGVPTLQDPEKFDLSGRGLRIVEALSDQWGIEPVPEPPGKTVWFNVSTEEESTPSHSCG